MSCFFHVVSNVLVEPTLLATFADEVCFLTRCCRPFYVVRMVCEEIGGGPSQLGNMSALQNSHHQNGRFHSLTFFSYKNLSTDA